jgi:hypothetical protein
LSARYYRRARKDANHKAVVDALLAAGCSVVDLSAVGGGCPDLLVGRDGVDRLLEVKNPERKTRGDNAAKTLAKQAEFRKSWRGRPVAVVESVSGALTELGAMAKHAGFYVPRARGLCDVPAGESVASEPTPAKSRSFPWPERVL